MRRYFTFRLFFAITAAVILLSGCKQIKYVPVYTTDSTATNHTDREREVDSVIVERNTIVKEADSALLAQLAAMGFKIDNYENVLFVLQSELRQKIRELESVKTDTVTVYREKPVPYPVEKEVKKPLTKWQKWCMSFGKIAMVLCAIGAVFLCLKVLQKIK